MEIGTGPVEQTDDGGVDVPHFVRASRAQPNLRLRRMHAEPGPPPAVLPDEVVPRRRGGPDCAEPLREHGERAGRDVRSSGEVTMASIAWTSDGVSRWGDVRGQDA